MKAMKLKKITVHKYKSFEEEQSFDVENDITILVGMNESGKTALLEAIAKANYFKDDDDFKFDLTLDYPRKEKKKIDKAIKNGEEYPKAITLSFEIENELLKEIEKDVGKDVFVAKEISITTKYDNNLIWSINDVDISKFLKEKLSGIEISDELIEKFKNIKNQEEFDSLLSNSKESIDNEKVNIISELKKYYLNEWKWNNPLSEYIAREYLNPNLPKFLYYDEYYKLPSRVSLEKLKDNKLGEGIDLEQAKTAKALIELADLDLEKVLKENNFEDLIAELESTEAIISTELFKYWNTNKNLKIRFRIDPIEKAVQPNNKRIVEHYLDIRVENTRAGVTLPLKNRSKGFVWFFSFLVWFNRIQEDSESQYILLLDEPGLNLHASAQRDLLSFIEDLSQNYQIIYTTHSPFAIPEDKLHRVRTIVETENGSIISDTLQEKDPKTLFPLQAALGYDIAQNLFISKKNLLVEGVSDMIYLEIMSAILEEIGCEGLRKDVTIVPTGGLDKVVTFISLLRGNKLDIVCLLDTPATGSEQNLNNAIRNKIIKEKNIRFFHEFVGYQPADIEDLFHKEDYLKLFNEAFKNRYGEIKLSDLYSKISSIILQINNFLKKNGEDRFNHYLPAKILSSKGYKADEFHPETLNNFEKVFKEINKLFG